MTIALKPAHHDLLPALTKADPALPVVVIGAQALLHHVPLERETKDVDLVLVASVDRIRGLLSSLGWTASALVPRWDHGGARVDVLPGAAEVLLAGFVDLGNGRRLSTVGFDLAIQHSVEAPVLGGPLRVRVASLASLVVLKMVAWLDRPEDRLRDLADLGRVFETGLDEEDERRWEPPLSELEFCLQAAHFLGREVRTIAGAKHRTKVLEFLDRSKRWHREIGAGGYVCEDPLELVAQRVAAFREGLCQ